MSEQLTYHFCYRTLTQGFTDFDLAVPGDVIQFPKRLGLFEVIKTSNSGDKMDLDHNKWVASPWLVTCRTLDRNGLPDLKGETLAFGQKVKEPSYEAKGLEFCHDLTFVNKQGGHDRKRLQDICFDIETDAKEKHGEVISHLMAREKEITEQWIARLRDPEENRNHLILEILETPNDFDQFGAFNSAVNARTVLVGFFTDEYMNDPVMVETVQSSLPKEAILTRRLMHLAVVDKFAKLQRQLEQVAKGEEDEAGD